jgi:DNA-binding NarL/FixJ family response regulator
MPARTAAGLVALLPDVDLVVVDLTARAYDGVAAIELAAAAGRPVMAVGQHDDRALQAGARAAGADRVYAYRKLFEDGPATLSAWIVRVSPP